MAPANARDRTEKGSAACNFNRQSSLDSLWNQSELPSQFAPCQPTHADIHLFDRCPVQSESSFVLVKMQTAMQSRLSSRAPAFTAVRPVRCIVSRSTAVVVRSSAVSAPATLPLKSVEGQDIGTAQMALKVAGETGKGLVHRYLVMVQQNARQVGSEIAKGWSSIRHRILGLFLCIIAYTHACVPAQGSPEPLPTRLNVPLLL